MPLLAPLGLRDRERTRDLLRTQGSSYRRKIRTIGEWRKLPSWSRKADKAFFEIFQLRRTGAGAGETLHRLGKCHDISRDLIRLELALQKWRATPMKDRGGGDEREQTKAFRG